MLTKSLNVRQGDNPHRHWCDANGEVAAQVEYWAPGMEKPITSEAENGGRPLVSLCDVITFHKNGTLGDFLQPLECLFKHVPPLARLSARAKVKV